MKGQYLTIEWVLFFAIGVAMTVLIYMVFTSVSGNIRETSAGLQIQEVGELIKGTMINVLEASNSSNSYIAYNLTVPTKVSGCIYAVELKGNILNINCTDNYRIGAGLSLYGFNTKKSQIIYSTKEKIEIIAEKGVVELR